MLLSKTKIFLEMIKIEHTLFALPFAFMGSLLGSVVIYGHLPSWATIGWILLAMVGARSAAMGLNRVIDKAIDEKNPRTAKRAIPAGLLNSKEVIIFIIISFVLLFIAASQLNPLSMELLPIAVVLLVGYSYTKRFTWLCHFILGLTIALAPLGGWVATTGKVDFTAIVFYLSVAFWTTGFDIIYACQDAEFDKNEGVYSIPGRFGVITSLWIAKVCHMVTAAGFISLIWLADLNGWYIAGILIANILLFYEHSIVSPQNLSRLNTAFFTLNSVLSIVMFGFTFIDLVVHTW